MEIDRSHVGRNVCVLRIPFREKKDWEQWVLLTSDRHWDHPHSDHILQRRHLKQAIERNAFIIDVGDFFCAMQGKYDKRASKSSVREEHQVDNYLDALVNTAAEFFEPYAKNFLVIARGNHETAIAKRHETDLTQRLVKQLNDRAGSQIQAGGYGGWVRFVFKSQMKTGKPGKSKSFNIKYFHGSGGGGVVTKGTLWPTRRAAYTPDADIVLTGHIHEQWMFPVTRERLSERGEVYIDRQIHLSIPSYKNEYQDGAMGWWVETEKMPRPMGCWWLRFFYDAAERLLLFEVRERV